MAVTIETDVAAPPEIRVGELVAGIDPERLAATFGMPLYVYDLDAVDRRAAAVRAVLPARFDLAYAVKANPSLAIVASLARLGLGADVASGGELEAALRAGLPASRIVMTGPGKRDDELARAIEAGVRAVTVESVGELELLAALAERAGRRIPVLLRLASAAQASAAEAAEAATRVELDDGTFGKFGMDGGELRDAARLAARRPSVELLGFHAYGVSNVTDASGLARMIGRTVEQACLLAAELDFPLRLVDAGGGLGIPYLPGDPALDLAAFGRALSELDARWARDPLTSRLRVVIEPGRYLVGPAGAYLVRVVATKILRGRRVAIVDGGIHHALRPVLVGREHRVVAVGAAALPTQPALTHASRERTVDGPDRVRDAVEGPDEGLAEAGVTIGGPLCTGLDLFARAAALAPPRVGDVLAVLDLGAYGFTESMPWFLSHPMPAEAGVRHGRALLLRPRLEPRAWLDAQLQPDW